MADYAVVKACIARRAEWVRSLKSGPCSKCSRRDDPTRMHWHHRDPATKSFTVAVATYRASRARILAEIRKCDLLCWSCHMALHDFTVRPCGTDRAYRNGCRCDACRAAHSKVMKDYGPRRKALRRTLANL